MVTFVLCSRPVVQLEGRDGQSSLSGILFGEFFNNKFFTLHADQFLFALLMPEAERVVRILVSFKCQSFKMLFAYIDSKDN